MADLSQMLGEILNSPEGLQKLQNAAASLGISLPTGEEESDSPVMPSEPDTGGFPDLSSLGDLSMITKLMPLISGMQGESEHAVLLKAIRPYLKNERRERLDQSVKILKMLKLLPLLKDNGGLF